MRIAVDCGISNDAIDVLEAAGHDVVYKAGEEPDEWWVKDALKYKPELFVSHDWDIVIIAVEKDCKAVRMPDGIAGAAQAKIVLDTLEGARRAY